MKKLLAILLLLPILAAAQKPFIHPGVMTDKTDMARMAHTVKKQLMPGYGSFLLIRDSHLSKTDYKMHGPYGTISRDGEYAWTKSKMEEDFSAVYLNTLMWICTRGKAHAERALEIMCAYADTLHTIPSTNDAPLLVGLEGFKIAYSLEILRHTYKGADAVRVAKIEKMLRGVFIPVMEKFYATPAYTNGNWGPIVTKAYMACAITFDDRRMYNKALDFYISARDNGTIKNYISGTTGQIQESGRDQGHSILGIGALATVCELAWKQGDDLWSALDNRLLKGYEYTAKYNLGNDDVPFETWTDVTGKYSNWTKISPVSRGKTYPIWELAYNHYVLRKGLEMPYTWQMILKIRPEGYDRDHPGFGTLLQYSGPQEKQK